MATYVNDLRLKEIGTGESSGTWGTETNVNLELIGEALGYGTEGITTNADTHTTTVADGATDPGRAMYIEYTGTLDSACTITIAPNTLNRMHFIENGTSGSQNIIISQGSGANITIPPGDVKAVYLDGAGSGAAVVDAFASLNVVDLKVQDDLTVTDDVIIGGDIDLEGSIDVNGTANLDVVDIDGAVNMATTALVTGVLTTTATQVATGGITSGSNIVSDTDSTDDLGTTGTRWANLFVDAITATDQITATGFTGTLDGILGSGSAAAATVTTLDSSGAVNLNLTTDSTSSTSGALIVDGGVGIAKKLFVGTDLDVDGTTNLDAVDIDGAVDMASTLQVDGAITSSAAATITTADNSYTLTLQSTDADASSGPNLRLKRDSSSPADDDFTGIIYFQAENDAGEETDYQRITTRIRDASDGSEDGQLTLSSMVAGTLRNRLEFNEAEAVFNDDSVDVDFRVESNANANAFFVDGGNDRVGIGRAPTISNSKLETSGADNVPQINVEASGATAGFGIGSSRGKFYYGSSEAITFAVGELKVGNLNFNGTSSSSLITAGNVILNISGGILTSGSSSLDLQFQVPVTGVGTSTAAKLDAPSGDWFTNDGSVSSLSDSRLKKDITTLTDGIDIVKQLRPVTFKYDDTTKDEDGSKYLGAASETVRYGFVAQEVEAVASHYVSTRDGKIKGETVSDLRSLSQTRMIPMLVKSIQELEARLTALES